MAILGVSTFEFTSFVRGHHVYCNVWTPVINEVLTLRREPESPFSVFAVAVRSVFAVAVTKDGEVVGHIPETIARVVLFSLAREGHSGSCQITGRRVNRGVQLQVEVPCIYKLFGRQNYVQRLKDLITTENNSYL